MPERPTRIRLTAQQKLALCQHRDAHPKLSLRALCAWAAKSFKLPKNPSPATLLVLFKAPVSATAVHARPTLKTTQPVRSQPLEQALVRWIERCEQLQLPVVTWATIRAKAEKIRAALMLAPAYVSDQRLESLIFSNGWIQKLLQRHGMKARRVHGEAASARLKDVEDGRAELRAVTSEYSPRDIFNLDESAYFYCMAPSTTVSKDSMSGRKKLKKRLTVAIAANADGSCKLPLLFVGTARQPRCFGKSTASELGVDYTSSAKGWMTSALFRVWLEHFNEKMRAEGRQTLLLLDNASPHRVTEALSNVTLRFLPPNTTAHLQPQDAGIIQAFKSRLNKIRNAHIVDKLDGILEREENEGSIISVHDVDQLYNVSVLDAMTWAQEAWSSVTSVTITNCWRHTGILAEDVYELVAGMEKISVASP